MRHTSKWCLNANRLKIFYKQVFYVNRNGTKVWWLNGKLHRENGPAIEFVDGDKSWYLNDKRYSESDYWKELRK